MRAIKIIVLGTGLMLLLAVAGTAYLVAYLDEHKDLLEQSASTVLGRDVRIEKGVSVDWSLTPSIALDGLWIGNPEWAKGEYLVRAERALVRLHLMDLLQRKLELKQVTIQEADVLLESTEDGRHNWSFGDDTGGIDTKLNALKVENSRLSYRLPTGEMRQLIIPEVMFSGLGTRQLEFKAGFSYQDIPVTASLKSEAQLVSLAGERPFLGELEIPGAKIAVSGELKGLFEVTKLALELQSERLDLQKYAAALGPWVSLEGSLQQLSGSFNTAGDTLQSLLSNLSGELKMAAADFTRPAAKGAEAMNVALNAMSIQVAPEQAVRLQTGLVYEKQTYQVDLSGGVLADLFSETGSWDALKVKIEGKVDKKPLQISGDVGPLSALHAGHGVKVKLAVSHDELEVRLNGSFAALDELEGSRFAVDASGPSLSRLNYALGLALPDTPSFTLAAQVEGNERHLQFKKIKVTSGKSDISGEMRIPLVQGGRIEGRLESRTLALEPFFALSDGAAEDAPPFMERELKLDALKGLGGTLQLKVAHLHLDAVELEQVGLDASLDKGHLTLKLGAEDKRFIGEVDLKPVGAEWRLAIHHEADTNLGELIDRGKHPDERSQAPLKAKMQLEGTGKTLAAMLASAEGTYAMVVGEGQLSETIARHMPLGSVLYTLLGELALIGPDKDKNKPPGKLECAVIQLDVSKGIAVSSKGLALRTDQMNVLGGGALNLSTGEINLQFKTARRKGFGSNLLGIADRFIGLSGTLDNPTVVLNPTSAATFGAAAWATGGLSLLADRILTRMTAFSNPCEHVLKQIKE